MNNEEFMTTLAFALLPFAGGVVTLLIVLFFFPGIC
jgi:hypothetical protein